MYTVIVVEGILIYLQGLALSKIVFSIDDNFGMIHLNGSVYFLKVN